MKPTTSPLSSTGSIVGMGSAATRYCLIGAGSSFQSMRIPASVWLTTGDMASWRERGSLNSTRVPSLGNYPAQLGRIGPRAATTGPSVSQAGCRWNVDQPPFPRGNAFGVGVPVPVDPDASRSWSTDPGTVGICRTLGDLCCPTQ